MTDYSKKKKFLLKWSIFWVSKFPQKRPLIFFCEFSPTPNKKKRKTTMIITNRCVFLNRNREICFHTCVSISNKGTITYTLANFTKRIAITWNSATICSKYKSAFGVVLISNFLHEEQTEKWYSMIGQKQPY